MIYCLHFSIMDQKYLKLNESFPHLSFFIVWISSLSYQHPFQFKKRELIDWGNASKKFHITNEYWSIRSIQNKHITFRVTRAAKYELYKVLSCYYCKYTSTFIGNLKMTVIPFYGKLQRYMILKRMPNEVNFNMRPNSKLKLWFAMTNQHT